MKSAWRNRRGQSTVEYILIVAVVLAAALLFLTKGSASDESNSGALRKGIYQVFNRSTSWTSSSAGKVPNAAATQPCVPGSPKPGGGTC